MVFNKLNNFSKNHKISLIYKYIYQSFNHIIKNKFEKFNNQLNSFKIKW